MSPRSPSCLRFLARARAAPRPAVSIRRRRRELSGRCGTTRSKPLAEPAFHVLASFPRAREGGRSASGFDLAAPAPAMGTLRREPIESAGRGVAVACVRSGISGWRDRAPDPWACGRQGGARRIPGRPAVLADGEAAAAFLFGDARSAVAELFGNSRSQQLAGGKPSDGLALCWILASAARDRSLNLHLKGAALPCLASFPRAREGGRLGQRFRFGGAGASYGDSSARADRNRWPRGGCGVCALWHFRLARSCS